MFRRFFQFSIVGFSCLFLFGCPLESDFSLGMPDVPVQAHLIGTWQSQDEVYNKYHVYRLTGKEYGIVQENSIGDKQYYRAFISVIKNFSFLNVYSDSLRTFFLMRIDGAERGNQVFIRPLRQPHNVQLSSATSLRTYVAEHVNQWSLYDTTEQTWYRRISDLPRDFQPPNLEKPASESVAPE